MELEATHTGTEMAAEVVVVAILTFRRPDGLARVLPKVLEQAQQLEPPASVVVVDNDPRGSAKAQVKDAGPDVVRYAHETTPGIAAARNRALSEADQADLLVFIDDDEVPAPGWLSALVGGWNRYRCAAVTGPVVSRFEGSVDPWVLASGHYARRSFPTGTLMRGAATNNLLLDLRILRRHELRFSTTFALTMGEDTRLTYELIRRGEQIRWVDNAEVTEVVPGGRSTKRWVQRRMRSSANTFARIHLDMAPTSAARLRVRVGLTVRGMVILARSPVYAGSGILRGDPTKQARARAEIARGSGLLSGLWGVRIDEYRRPRTGA